MFFEHAPERCDGTFRLLYGHPLDRYDAHHSPSKLLALLGELMREQKRSETESAGRRREKAYRDTIARIEISQCARSAGASFLSDHSQAAGWTSPAADGPHVSGVVGGVANP
jgi:hypothetical protein